MAERVDAVELLLNAGAKVLVVFGDMGTSLFSFVFDVKKNMVFRQIMCEKAYVELLCSTNINDITLCNLELGWESVFNSAVFEVDDVGVKMLLCLLFSIAEKLGILFDVVSRFVTSNYHMYLENAIHMARDENPRYFNPEENVKALRNIEMLLMIGYDRSSAIPNNRGYEYEECVKRKLSPENAKRILSFHHNITLFELLNFRLELCSFK